MINRKSKGSNSERELVSMFWKAGWAAIRVAGSGLTKNPNPDVLAANKIRRVAIECKATKETKKYFSKHDIEQLKKFSEMFGCEAWIGIRFNNMKWLFISTEDLEKTKKGYVASIELMKRRGLLFEELIS